MSLKDFQNRLNQLGYDAGPNDGLWGRRTYTAAMAALDKLERTHTATPDWSQFRVVPLEWMPMANMQRIINHWSAGAYSATTTPQRHYHLCIENPVKLARGDHSIKDNEVILRGKYAAHTRGINTGSIGVSVMSMYGAKEVPYDAGRYPMTQEQWNFMVKVNADLCERYHIEVTERTVLSHAEVQATLGVWQRAKWDFTRLPFAPSVRGAKAIGDKLREEVKRELSR